MDLTAKERTHQDGGDGPLTLEIIDNVAIVRMKRGENRINATLLEKLNETLDEVER